MKGGTGTFTPTAASSYTGFTTISNGVLSLAFNTNTATDGSLDGTTNIDITSGGILDVSTRSDGTLQLNGSQTLQGSGTASWRIERFWHLGARRSQQRGHNFTGHECRSILEYDRDEIESQWHGP